MPQGLLCQVPFEAPHPGTCRRELLLQGVYSAVSSFLANLLSHCQRHSCSEVAPNLSGGSLLGDHSSHCSCSLPAPMGAVQVGRACAPCRCRLAFQTHSSQGLHTGLANRAWKDTQGALPAGLPKGRGLLRNADGIVPCRAF